MQTVCFYALEALLYREKLSEVLAAINASANHGILMFILRRVVANLNTGDVVYSAEFVDGILSFIATLITSQNGGNTIVSAGIIPVLVQILENYRQTQMRTVSRVLTILDSILYGFNQSFDTFIESQGLAKIVIRIEKELERIISLADKTNEENMVSPVSPRAVIGTFCVDLLFRFILPLTLAIPSDNIPFEFMALFKSLLRFLLHIMQASSTSDRVRNLIEGSLPDSLKMVIERNKIFGGAIYALGEKLY